MNATENILSPVYDLSLEELREIVGGLPKVYAPTQADGVFVLPTEKVRNSGYREVIVVLCDEKRRPVAQAFMPMDILRLQPSGIIWAVDFLAGSGLVYFRPRQRWCAILVDDENLSITPRVVEAR